MAEEVAGAVVGPAPVQDSLQQWISRRLAENRFSSINSMGATRDPRLCQLEVDDLPQRRPSFVGGGSKRMVATTQRPEEVGTCGQGRSRL
jgi:hypothetical protein